MQDASPIFATIAAARAEGLSEVLLTERVWSCHGITCAMLALDSSGMTRSSQAQGIVHFLGRYLQMRRLIEPVLEVRACLGWRSFADNLFAEFADSDSALRAAREIHRVIRESGLMLTEDEPFRVCLAVGHGRVLDNGRAGVMGEEMNLVAKLAEDVATEGETLLTESGYRSLQDRASLRVAAGRCTLSGVDLDYFRVCD
ncbi:MAG: adenylate/guanylate cyclase domain-containing protein [Verrucomicrobia bacterium]|nr:adenylate/guanylate cyclase domain-containing protein [Verrucomicrobiota bacterium]